jgi:hypothetical protein
MRSQACESPIRFFSQIQIEDGKSKIRTKHKKYQLFVTDHNMNQAILNMQNQQDIHITYNLRKYTDRFCVTQ